MDDLNKFQLDGVAISKKLTQQIPKNDRGSRQSKFKKIELIAKEHPENTKKYCIFNFWK